LNTEGEKLTEKREFARRSGFGGGFRRVAASLILAFRTLAILLPSSIPKKVGGSFDA
jgi:hypothetical protein